MRNRCYHFPTACSVTCSSKATSLLVRSCEQRSMILARSAESGADCQRRLHICSEIRSICNSFNSATGRPIRYFYCLKIPLPFLRSGPVWLGQRDELPLGNLKTIYEVGSRGTTRHQLSDLHPGRTLPSSVLLAGEGSRRRREKSWVPILYSLSLVRRDLQATNRV